MEGGREERDGRRDVRGGQRRGREGQEMGSKIVGGQLRNITRGETRIWREEAK